MKWKTLRLYADTIRYLKSKQVFYQVYYRIRKSIGNKVNYPKGDIPVFIPQLIPSIHSGSAYLKDGKFSFLNQEKDFGANIDWNFTGYGKLWVYNLNYFDFLNQQSITVEEGRTLLDDFCKESPSLQVAVEPYPISLRGINWIKFFSANNINNPTYNNILRAHYTQLLKYPEYHLLGNHLLENAYSLLFGAYFFRDASMYNSARQLLVLELNEQILEDGAHYELSPMYHQILLYRLLDCINLLAHNNWKEDDDLLNFLKRKAALMLGWLEKVTFKNGDIPHVNDSTEGIAPTTRELFDYALRLELKTTTIRLNKSGYRSAAFGGAELFLDVGNIGPDYIPGHAHSDTLNFILYHNNQPIVVDAGITTYEKNQRRQEERSTRSHNTIRVAGQEQSEIWGGFRVGRRARIISVRESENEIQASHDGYRHRGVVHSRLWRWTENMLNIEDVITGGQKAPCEAFLHFHPDVTVNVTENSIEANDIRIELQNFQKISAVDYDFSEGFNKKKKAILVVINFQNILRTTFKF